MNLRQRFIEVMRFNRDVHTVKWEFGYWGETIKNWYESGLPQQNYPKLPTQVTTPTSSLYIPAWTCRSKTVLPNGIGVMAGVSITNHSRFEPMVMLKHFGPNHPDVPRTISENR